MPNDEALVKCRAALELRDKGDYVRARETMLPLWKGVGHQPDVKGLEPPVVAEFRLAVGILTSWLGSKEGVEKAQEAARDLIGEAIAFYESVGDVKMIAVSQAEIAYCHFREGALNEARTMLTKALQILYAEGNTRARALLKLTTVEWSASRYNVALGILVDNESLFNKIPNHTTRGNYHNELAIVLRNLATAEKREDYFQRAISEYEKADRHFKLAHNKIFRANVKNNLGFLFYKLSRFKKAHEHIDHARRLAMSLKDRVLVAQFDESKAQVLIAENRIREAEVVARGAVRTLEKSGQQGLLTDALITQGIALARLKRKEQAQFTFQKAIEIALEVDALDRAGLAALTLVEEIDELPPELLDQACDRASEWLAKSENPELLLRVIAASKKVRVSKRGDLIVADDASDVLIDPTRDLHKEVLEYEGLLIKQALVKTNGRLTRAASLLTLSYQGLAYIIESRHRNLLKDRTPVRRRSGGKLDSQSAGP
jgi:tetratricopeptide (TPR) repeat protein